MLKSGLSFDEMQALYLSKMGPELNLTADGRFKVRLWDGMDGCWTDCTLALSAEDALDIWCRKTKNGTEKTSFNEIDYYNIFPADTRMTWDGSEGREMFRGGEE